MKIINKADASALLRSKKKDEGTGLGRFSTRSAAPSVLTSSIMTEETFRCDPSGEQESIVHPDQHDHSHSKRFSSRFQPNDFSNLSLRHPFRARSSIGSKSTAVDSASFTSPSPSSPLRSPSQLKRNTKLLHRSISPITYTSLGTLNPQARPAICSQPPSQPPPTCPLPSLPVNQLPTNSPSSFRSTLSVNSSPASSPLSRSRSGHLFLTPSPQNLSPRLQTPVNLFHVQPKASHCQALHSLESGFYDDDPFAAEQLVVSRPLNCSTAAWFDEESVDPLGPIPYPNSPTSVYTATSESCYSVNTTIERFSQVSLDVATFASSSQPDEPLNSITMSEDSQDGPRTPSICSEEEDLSQSSIPPLQRMPIPSPEASPSRHFSFRPCPIPVMETFSFGLPSRFDGLFFGCQKHPKPRYHTAPAIVLEVSPPISSTSFSPGDSIHIKVCLASLFDNLIVSFVGESRMLGERKLKSHRFLKHELDLDRTGQWGCWIIQRGSSLKEWFIDFKIPSLSNCYCEQRLGKRDTGGLNLPSSTINNQIFISYHLIIRGIGKQKKNEENSKRKKKAKSEEKMRLTVMIKNKKNSSSQTGIEQVEAGHAHSCFSIG